MSNIKVTMLSREFPPNIYGGAGVHVDYLTRSLRKIMAVDVRCFGQQEATGKNWQVRGFQPRELFDSGKVREEGAESNITGVLGPMSTDLAMVGKPVNSDVVHAHTWYTLWAGFLAKKLYDIPLVATVHSLEPLRPWKREQLGTGYELSSWMEKVGLEGADRIIAVSGKMREDILTHYEVEKERIVKIYNGIDLNEYRPVTGRDALEKYDIDGDYILFVGRISRQKGITNLLAAVEYLPADIRVVLCAGKADTEEILAEVREKVAKYSNVIWINKMVPREEIVELYTHARIFVCPSVYEPFGIINLEAMACETPVVASSVGGITEVVVDGETGLLVPPAQEKKLAAAINNLLEDEGLQKEFGRAGRRRVEEQFSWDSIARQTLQVYRELI